MYQFVEMICLSLKWKSTEIGDHSLMSISFNDAEVDIAITNNEAKKLQAILNDIKHDYRSNVGVGKDLESEVSDNVIGPKVKETLRLWRDQLNSFLDDNEPVYYSTDGDSSCFYVDYQNNDEDVLDLLAAYNLLGCTLNETESRLGNMNIEYILKRNDISWSSLPVERFDKRFGIESEIIGRVSVDAKYVAGVSSGRVINDVANDVDLPVYIVWACCVARGISFDIHNCMTDSIEHIYVRVGPSKIFDSNDDFSIHYKDAYNKLDSLGGIKFLKECKSNGMFQREIANKYGISISHLRRYIVNIHKEDWGEW